MLNEHDMKLLCNYFTFTIVLLALFFFIGTKFGQYLRVAEITTVYEEEWYQKKSGEIYTFASLYLDCKDSEEKDSIRKELNVKIKAYNSATRNIKKWTYRCPKHFTLDYLIGDYK